MSGSKEGSVKKGQFGDWLFYSFFSQETQRIKVRIELASVKAAVKQRKNVNHFCCCSSVSFC